MTTGKKEKDELGELHRAAYDFAKKLESEIKELEEEVEAKESTNTELREEIGELNSSIQHYEEQDDKPVFETMMDEMKYECFLECMDNFSLSQLEKALNREVITKQKAA